MADINLFLQLQYARLRHWTFLIVQLASLAYDRSPFDDVEHIYNVWQYTASAHVAKNITDGSDIFRIRHIERARHVGLRLRCQPDAHLRDNAHVGLEEESFDGGSKAELREMC